MSYDNEAIVRNAYHTAEGTFWTFPDGPAASPRMACLNNISGEGSYRGEHLKD